MRQTKYKQSLVYLAKPTLYTGHLCTIEYSYDHIDTHTHTHAHTHAHTHTHAHSFYTYCSHLVQHQHIPMYTHIALAK